MPARNTSKTSSSHSVYFHILISVMITIGFMNVLIFVSHEPETVTIDTTEDDYAFWDKIVKQNPTYRDGYIVLSQLKRKEGDSLESQKMLGKAEIVDPFMKGGLYDLYVLGVKDKKK